MLVDDSEDKKTNIWSVKYDWEILHVIFSETTGETIVMFCLSKISGKQCGIAHIVIQMPDKKSKSSLHTF